MMATVNAFTNSTSPECGPMPSSVGTASSTASPPTADDSIHPRVRIRATRTPFRRATSSSTALARIASPSGVRVKSRNTAATTTATTTNTKSVYGDTIASSPMVSGSRLNGTVTGL
jgi:hypothetical protein